MPVIHRSGNTCGIALVYLYQLIGGSFIIGSYSINIIMTSDVYFSDTLVVIYYRVPSYFLS